LSAAIILNSLGKMISQSGLCLKGKFQTFIFYHFALFWNSFFQQTIIGWMMACLKALKVRRIPS
ncbi:MAG: hypothetical protein KIG68_07375, partial [Oxalobacter sp.]|nr:hypothetical protein [Oxalobacter sp.]